MTDGDGFHVNHQGLRKLTDELRDVATHLERAAKSPPPMPEVSVSSQKVGDTLSTTTKTAAALIASTNKNADDVHACDGTYKTVENDNIELMQHKHDGLPG